MDGVGLANVVAEGRAVDLGVAGCAVEPDRAPLRPPGLQDQPVEAGCACTGLELCQQVPRQAAPLTEGVTYIRLISAPFGEGRPARSASRRHPPMATGTPST
jgi:hypothetical protein